MDDPSLVWEFYEYRRRVVSTKLCNPAHRAIAEFQKQLSGSEQNVTLITQNIDRLHFAAGSPQLIEMHGTLWETKCLSCGDIKENRTV